MNWMLENLSKLVDVKSIVTLVLTICMVVLLCCDIEPNKELLALFCASYGSITTYFFTKKDKKD